MFHQKILLQNPLAVGEPQTQTQGWTAAGPCSSAAGEDRRSSVLISVSCKSPLSHSDVTEALKWIKKVKEKKHKNPSG